MDRRRRFALLVAVFVACVAGLAPCWSDAGERPAAPAAQQEGSAGASAAAARGAAVGPMRRRLEATDGSPQAPAEAARMLRARLVGLRDELPWTAELHLLFRGEQRAGRGTLPLVDVRPDADGAFAVALPDWTRGGERFGAHVHALDQLYLRLDHELPVLAAGPCRIVLDLGARGVHRRSVTVVRCRETAVRLVLP